MAIKWLSEYEKPLEGKRVFCRVDFNVPFDSEGNILDDARIKEALPTINYLIEQKARVVLASHLGRPKGKKRAGLTMEKVAEKLHELIDVPVLCTEDVEGDGVKKLSAILEPGSVLLLENLRFHAGEEKNDLTFAKKLRDCADIYVCDAFGVVHRSQASVDALPGLMETKLGGLLLQKELKAFERLTINPKRPFVGVLGGSKVSDKIEVILALLKKVNRLLIGGAMAYTFLKAKGHNVGKSLVEEASLEVAGRILNRAKAEGVELLLPIDHVTVKALDAAAQSTVYKTADFPKDVFGIDIGPNTRSTYLALLKDAKTVFFNGPLGISEWDSGKEGTQEILGAIARSTAYSVVGGGDSMAALKGTDLAKEISHVSTGGGAALALLGKQNLPGLKVLGFGA